MIQPQHVRNVATAANFANTTLTATGGRPLHVLRINPAHLTITVVPSNAEDTPHVTLLFSNMIAKDQAMDEAARTRIVDYLIQPLTDKNIVFEC